jgi:hypothetical protein
VNAFERRVRTAVYASLRDEAVAPSVARVAADLGAPRKDVAAALHRLADLHCLVLVPGTESIWMAHPFSGIETVWDGLALLALLGDGVLATHSPATSTSRPAAAASGATGSSTSWCPRGASGTTSATPDATSPPSGRKASCTAGSTRKATPAARC